MSENIFTPESERLDEINERLKLIQRRRGLTFGTDAYLLAAFTKAVPCGRAADLGCGTGVISLLCAARGRFSKIYACELQSEYASLTERNVKLNGLLDKISVLNIDVRDLTQKDTEGQLDAVFTNPPYMKANSGRENPDDEKNIARRELNGTVVDFCNAAGRLLKSGGRFYAVHRPERMCDLICAMRESGIEPKRLQLVCQRVGDAPMLILCEGRRGGNSGMTLLPPLIVEDGQGGYSPEMKEIYKLMEGL